MTLLTTTSPHTSNQLKTNTVMQLVLLASLPGLLVLTYFFGWGSLINVIWASILALGFEAFILLLRKRPIWFYLSDSSALVTALLLGIALPPLAPWWLVIVGIGFAIIIAKHLYGGIGYNPFNPAMVGYIVLLIAFPVEMTRWLAPTDTANYQVILSWASFVESLHIVFIAAPDMYDGITMATPLDTYKNSLTVFDTTAIQQQYPMFTNMMGFLVGQGWQWANLAFLFGGLFLWYKKIISWQTPMGLLIGLTIMSVLFYDSDHHASPLLHLFSGATMLGAFFIATDPISSATSNKGRFIFGFSIGVLTYIIRTWGGYPDGVAFAVLLMNFAAPFIDYFTQPRTYGHKKPRRKFSDIN